MEGQSLAAGPNRRGLHSVFAEQLRVKRGGELTDQPALYGPSQTGNAGFSENELKTALSAHSAESSTRPAAMAVIEATGTEVSELAAYQQADGGARPDFFVALFF